MLSITSDMGERQGLDPNKWYEAKVIENDDRKHPDKMMLGRIQARIKTIFDGIEDKDLPWAIPVYQHPDGAQNIAGVFSVPKKGAKVLLKFQQSNPAFPMYRGFHVDVLTQMEETKYNYPDRTVVRLSNKALLIADTKDNRLYLRNPGDTKIYIDGNVAIEINGNVDELIHGNVRRRIKGNLDEQVDGARHYYTGKSRTESVQQAIRTYSGSTTLHEAGSTMMIEGGPNIMENCGLAQGDPGEAKHPVFEVWPGVPGSAKGTNRRNTPTKSTCAQPAPTYAEDSSPAEKNAGINNGGEVPFGSYS